ncbi:MAG: ROK family protein [Acidobacteriota bacterium]
MRYVAGVDLGGTAVNYTVADEKQNILIQGLCEHPARSVEGPDICLTQIADGLELALAKAKVSLADVAAVGLDTPGPASAKGVLSAKGSTNFVHPEWAGYDIRGGLEKKIGKPVVYLNDANAAALWGHFALYGTGSGKTTISVIVGTGCGGGVIIDDKVIEGRNGFGGELGHVLIPYSEIPEIEGLKPVCNCGRIGDLESLCSLTSIRMNVLPHLLQKNPGHELCQMEIAKAAYSARGLAAKGDTLCRQVFKVQAHALGLFFDEMINTFDPDALIIGGGVLEATEEFKQWFIGQIRAGMPKQRVEQADIPIHVIPNGDCAGALGAAIGALQLLK